MENMASNIDLLPTFASILGMPLQGGPIDGVDVSELLLGEDKPVRKEMLYYRDKNLAAYRSGRWKLHRTLEGKPNPALYDLETDIGEAHDLYQEKPEIAAELEAEIRPCLCVPDPKPLTEYDENHPYIVALYDKSDAG